jgi:ribonuclease BN (tRNA processing enzyme)
MSITLTILGSGTCVPSVERSSSAVLLRIDGRCFLVDAGAGTMRRLIEAGCGLSDLGYLALSHFHPDHVADLVPMLFAMKYPANLRRTTAFHLIAGEGFSDFYRKLRDAFGRWIEPEADVLRIHEVSVSKRDEIDFGGFRLISAPACHNPESVAYRLSDSDGNSVVVSGDTDVCEAVVALAEGADVLVLECAMPDERKVDGHLSPSLAGKMATDAGVKTLVLTHFYPECDAADIAGQCRRSYAGELILARDLLEIQVDPGGSIRVPDPLNAHHRKMDEPGG